MTRPGFVRTGALTALAAGFFVSGLLRASDVIAALPTTAETQPSVVEAEQPMPSLGTLAAELQRQRAELDRRRDALDDREQLLLAMESRIRLRLSELETARERLAETAVLADDAASRDLKHVGDMYQRMKPKQSGKIFDTMAPNFAAGFLGQMPAEPAAQILANMAPANAYAVTLLLAGRNAGRGSGIAVSGGSGQEPETASMAPEVQSPDRSPLVQGSSTDLP